MLQDPKTLSDDVPGRRSRFPTMEWGLELARRLSKLKGPLEVSGVDDRPLTGTSLSRERHAKKSRSLAPKMTVIFRPGACGWFLGSL